jgi:hypothetical protein
MNKRIPLVSFDHTHPPHLEEAMTKRSERNMMFNVPCKNNNMIDQLVMGKESHLTLH